MSYTPTNWQSGDIVTSEKLNKLENGVAGAGGVVLVVNTTTDDDKITLNKTWKQIYDADFAVIISEDDGKYYTEISGIYEDGGNYIVTTRTNMIFTANSENGYPQHGLT